MWSMGPFISSLLLIAVCTVIGVRLVALARRSRGLPELLIGGAFLLAGFFGIGFALLRAILPVPGEARIALAAISALGMHCGVFCIAAFTWRVFRPADLAGKLVFGVLATLLLASLASGLAGVDANRASNGVDALWSLTVCAVVYLWAAFESARYALLIRRRVRIGLGDPFVAVQMACWSLASLSIASGWLHQVALSLAGAESTIGSYWTTLCVFVCAIAYWLAFFPPAWFRRWASAGSPSAAAP